MKQRKMNRINLTKKKNDVSTFFKSGRNPMKKVMDFQLIKFRYNLFAKKC